MVLGRVIEKVSGTSYADYMRHHIFNPLGPKNMKLAQSQVEHLARSEVHYYGFDGNQDLPVLSIFPGEGFVNASYEIVDYRNDQNELFTFCIECIDINEAIWYVQRVFLVNEKDHFCFSFTRYKLVML